MHLLIISGCIRILPLTDRLLEALRLGYMQSYFSFLNNFTTFYFKIVSIRLLRSAHGRGQCDTTEFRLAGCPARTTWAARKPRAVLFSGPRRTHPALGSELALCSPQSSEGPCGPWGIQVTHWPHAQVRSRTTELWGVVNNPLPPPGPHQLPLPSGFLRILGEDLGGQSWLSWGYMKPQTPNQRQTAQNCGWRHGSVTVACGSRWDQNCYRRIVSWPGILPLPLSQPMSPFDQLWLGSGDSLSPQNSLWLYDCPVLDSEVGMGS